MNTRLRLWFAALLVAVMASVAVAAPAQAAVGDCTNYANTMCLWKDSNAGGSIWRQTDSQVSSTCTSLVPWGWNDQVTSFRNNTPGKVMELYWDSNCSGTPILGYYGFTYNLAGNPWDNQISGLGWRWA